MGGTGRLPDFFSFPCSADHERDLPPCKLVFHVDASRGFYFVFSYQQRAESRGQGGGAARLFFFSCSADHERDWSPCKVIFRVGNQYVECEKQQQQQQHPTISSLPIQSETRIQISARDAAGARDRASRCHWPCPPRLPGDVGEPHSSF